MTKYLQNNNTKHRLWKHPWGFAESIIITFLLLIIGIGLEVIKKGNGINPLQWPINLIVLIVYVMAMVVFHSTNTNSIFIRWITNLPTTLCSIALSGILILLMGVIPQENKSSSEVVKLIGFSNLKISFPFIISQIFLLTSLGFTILRRLSLTFTTKNLAFLANHIGLWIAISIAYIGSGDIQKINMYLFEGKDFTHQAYIGKHNKEPKVLPFEVKLLSFDIVNNPPEFGIFNPTTNNRTIKEVLNKGSNYNKIKYKNWQIKLVYFMRSASQIKNDFVESNYSGSAPALYIMARDTANFISKAGWITCGSHTINEKKIQLDNNTEIFMTKPIPKEFSSSILFKKETGEIDTAKIEVNKPLKLGKWKLYQSGYNKKMGIWSDLSILEAVKDPWLPGIYIGIVLMIVSSLYMIWKGYKE